MAISEEDERRYNLPPMPDVDNISVKRSKKLQSKYEKAREKYRKANPHSVNQEER